MPSLHFVVLGWPEDSVLQYCVIRRNLKQVNTKIVLGTITLFQILVSSFISPSWFLLPLCCLSPLLISYNLSKPPRSLSPHFCNSPTMPISLWPLLLLISSLPNVDLGLSDTLCHAKRGTGLRGEPLFPGWQGKNSQFLQPGELG